MAILLWLDPAGYERDGFEHLALHAVRLDPAPSTPVATAAEFRRFIGAHHANDRNGTWDPAGIAEGDGALIYTDECGREVWPVVDIVDGAPVYAVAGWNWEV